MVKIIIFKLYKLTAKFSVILVLDYDTITVYNFSPNKTTRVYFCCIGSPLNQHK